MRRLVVCVLLFGCGGDDGGGGGFIELENFGLEISTASCGRTFECCTDAEIMAQFMGITHDGQPIETEDQCVSFSNAVFTTLAVMRYQESIALGRMEYDGAAAADCVAAINRLSCAQYGSGELDGLAGCRPYLTPKVADGGACTQDVECTSDNCEGERTPLGGPSTDGVCKPMPAPGQVCDNSCPDDHYCGTSPSSSMKTCQALRADGAQCNVDSQCTSDNCDTQMGTCSAKPLTCDGR